MRGMLPLLIDGNNLSDEEVNDLKLAWDQLIIPQIISEEQLQRAILGGTVLVKKAGQFMIQKDYDYAVLLMCNEMVRRYTW